MGHMIAGGAAGEAEVSLKLAQYAKTISGIESECINAYAEALEVVPYTLAQNAGLNALLTVTELRNRHASGDRCAGINVRRGTITDILEENVVQPLLVSTSAFTLATESVCMILKIVRPPRPRCSNLLLNTTVILGYHVLASRNNQPNISRCVG